MSTINISPLERTLLGFNVLNVHVKTSYFLMIACLHSYTHTHTHKQTHTHTHTHTPCHSWLLLKVIQCLTFSLCIPVHPSVGLCTCLCVGWRFGGCVYVFDVSHNDNITVCKVPQFKSSHVLCLGLYVCACLSVLALLVCPSSCPRFIHWHKMLLATWL